MGSSWRPIAHYQSVAAPEPTGSRRSVWRKMWLSRTCLYETDLVGLCKPQTRYDGGSDLGRAVERRRIISSELTLEHMATVEAQRQEWEEAQFPEMT